MLWQLAAFVAVLVAFHTSEFALAVIYMRHQLSYKCKCRVVARLLCKTAGETARHQPASAVLPE